MLTCAPLPLGTVARAEEALAASTRGLLVGCWAALPCGMRPIAAGSETTFILSVRTATIGRLTLTKHDAFRTERSGPYVLADLTLRER